MERAGHGVHTSPRHKSLSHMHFNLLLKCPMELRLQSLTTRPWSDGHTEVVGMRLTHLDVQETHWETRAGGVRGNQSMFLSHINVSLPLSPSLPLYVKISKNKNPQKRRSSHE